MQEEKVSTSSYMGHMRMHFLYDLGLWSTFPNVGSHYAIWESGPMWSNGEYQTNWLQLDGMKSEKKEENLLKTMMWKKIWEDMKIIEN